MTDVDGTCRDWVRDLGAQGPVQEAACAELYGLLLRVARSEAARRSAWTRIVGPELDDLAHQAAGDALVTISRRLATFRGESKFTTWACKFVIFDVATKLARHHWRHRDVPFDQEDWSRLVTETTVGPEDAAQESELVDAVVAAVRGFLTDRQRIVFVATVLNGVPTDVLADRLGSTRNAIYKVLFDSRRKIRAALVAGGHLAAGTRSDLAAS